MGIKTGAYITHDVNLDSPTILIHKMELDTYFVYDIGFNIPQPKLTMIDTLGMNGAIDASEAVGGEVFFGNRTINMSLTVKDGYNNGDAVCSNFMKTYAGRKVRLYIDDAHFFRGRLSVIGDNKDDRLRQLSVTIDAEPLKMSKDYYPSNSGDILIPRKMQGNLWPDMDITTNGGGVHATSNGFTATKSDAFAELEIYDDSESDTLHRIYIENTVNVSEIRIEVLDGQGMGKRIISGTRGKGSTFVLGDINGTKITVYPLTAAAYSADISVRKIPTQTISNWGLSTPLEIANDAVVSPSKPLLLNLNGINVDINSIYTQDADWKEHPELMLKSGENVLALFVNSSSFDPASDIRGTVNARYRTGEL